jgi:hypothetical protein
METAVAPRKSLRKHLVFAFMIACSIAFWITASGCCGMLQLENC